MTSIVKKDIFISFAIIIAGIAAFAAIVFADTVTTQVIVGNATPSVTTTTLNNSSAITLTENTTATIYATTTVSDANGCSNIYAVTGDIYRSGVTAASCDTVGEADNNNCYPRQTATVVAGTCTGGTDTTADYVFSVDIQYYADATDTGTYSAQTWETTVEVGDGSATSTGGVANVELNTLLSLDVTSSVDFGTLSANADTGATNQTTTVTNTGNADMDPEVSGTDMTSGGDTVDVSNQEYSTSSFTYGSGTGLSTTPTQVNMTLPQGTSGTVPVNNDLYWGIGIPAGTPEGTYSGTNTFTAAAGI